MDYLAKLCSVEHISYEHLVGYIHFIAQCKNENANMELTYKEHHHVLPRKLFPQYKDLQEHPWNGIYLTIKQHIWAHWYLMKAYDGAMIFAFRQMSNRGKSALSKEELNEIIPLLEEAKIKAVLLHSAIMKEKYKNPQNTPTYNKRCITNGTVNKMISKDEEVPIGWRYGQDDKTKEKKRLAHTGTKHSSAHSNAISKGLTGFKRTLEQNKANSMRQLGKVEPLERNKKRSDTMKLHSLIWVTDGIKEKRISKTEIIQPGWRLGRIYRIQTNKMKKQKYIDEI